MHLESWLNRELKKVIPAWLIVLLCLGMAPLGALLPEALSGNLAGASPYLLIPSATAGFCFLLFSRDGGTRWDRFRLFEKTIFGFRGKVPERVPNRDMLEALASEVHQIQSLIRQTPLDASQQRRLTAEAGDRMWRLVALSVRGSSFLGLTTDEGSAQMSADSDWLVKARQLVEAAIPSKAAAVESDLLKELRDHAEARERAFEELRAMF